SSPKSKRNSMPSRLFPTRSVTWTKQDSLEQTSVESSTSVTNTYVTCWRRTRRKVTSNLRRGEYKDVLSPISQGKDDQQRNKHDTTKQNTKRRNRAYHSKL